MSTGKAIAQAGHAFIEAYFDTLTTNPSMAATYRGLSPGTKITLAARSKQELLRLSEKCKFLEIPSRIIIDSGHVELPDFDGSPTVTALGIGPIDKQTSRKLLSSLRLWTGSGGAL